MTDSALNQFIVAQLDYFMPLDPVLSTLAGLTVATAYQPRQQGAQAAATVYFHKLFDKRLGFPKTQDIFVDPVSPDPVGTMRHEETQVYETHYQFTALVPQDPSAINRTTASDALNVVAGIIASDAFIARCRAVGLGILRVLDVKNPYFVDDRDRFEASPSFDVVFTHKRVRTTTEAVLVTYDANVGRV